MYKYTKHKKSVDYIDQMKYDLLDTSKSLCPECLKSVDCQIISRDDEVFMIKECDEHGTFESLIYSDADEYLLGLESDSHGIDPRDRQGKVEKGCPRDCGLCENHRQHTCVGVIEINDDCDLRCPVCFADSQGEFSLSLEKVKEMIDLFVRCEEEPEVLQISGGEPTQHPDILEIMRYAGRKEIKYPMLNTNGKRLAEKDFAEELSETIEDGIMDLGLPMIYLQFDGFDDDIYKELRGEPLLDTKKKALKNCREAGLSVALVSTIVPGINDHQIGRIIEFALDRSNIKMVNFQPAAVIGRFDIEEERKMTIPEVLAKIESQTSPALEKDSFLNVPCPFPTCSVSSYVYKGEGDPIVLTDLLKTDSRYIQDSAVPGPVDRDSMFEVVDDLVSRSEVMNLIESENCSCSCCDLSLSDLEGMIDDITLIEVHAFMDGSDYDIRRAEKCCVTEILPDGRMIPFCNYNILYRKDPGM